MSGLIFVSIPTRGHLFLGADGPDRIRKSVEADAFAACVALGVLSDADIVMASTVLAIEHEGGRNVMLPMARALMQRVTCLGVAAILTGRHDYRLRGVAELENAAAFADWNPGHFLDAAEMAAAFAIGLDWFGPAINRVQHSRLADALAEKALRPGLRQFQTGAFWTDATHNWNVVCCGGLIVAALGLRQTGCALAGEVLDHATKAIRHGLSAYDRDGGYPEGPGYWEYATRYAALAAAALDHHGLVLPGLENLAHSWRFNRATTAPSGAVFDYGDTLLRPPRSPVLGWVAGLSGDAAAAEWQRNSPGDPHPFDLVWLSRAPIAVSKAAPGAESFGGAGITTLRACDGGADIFVGLKGGRNGDNHAHLDLGAFIVEWNAGRLFSELGRDDYALPGYFDPARRFDYYRLGTAGHGTLLVDGGNQSTTAVARCLGTSDRPDFCAAAYEIEDAASPLHHRRGIAIAGGCIWIVDELARKPGRTGVIDVEWRGFSAAVVAAKGSIATLCLGETEVEARLVGGDAEWRAGPASSPVGEAGNDGFTLLSFGFSMRADVGRCCVAIASPGFWHAGPQDMPPAIADWGLRADTGTRG